MISPERGPEERVLSPSSPPFIPLLPELSGDISGWVELDIPGWAESFVPSHLNTLSPPLSIFAFRGKEENGEQLSRSSYFLYFSPVQYTKLDCNCI